MKATYIAAEDALIVGESRWSAEQRGRELTVYIFRHHYNYADGGPMAGLTDNEDHEFWLSREFEGLPGI